MDSQRIFTLGRFPFPWDGRRIPICANQRDCAKPGGVFYASGTAVVIVSSAEPQMQRTSMFFLELFGYCSC